MAIYNISGGSLSACYSVNETALSVAYDINGSQIYTSGSAPSVEPMDWSSMTDYSKANINSIVEYAQTYIANNTNAYAFPVLTDVHDQFYNEPNYVLYNYPDAFDKFLFLGDIANAYTETQLDNALAYMEEANSITVLPLVGNHELGGWADGDTLPKEWYQTLLPSSAVTMDADALVYYWDDNANNVRYICLDSCTPIYQSSGTQRFTLDQLEYCASAMDSSNGKDLIFLNHAIIQSFYLVTDTEQTTVKYSTTVNNSGTLRSLVNAYKNRTSYTFADDSDVSHTHDYSNATGNVVGFFSGHYHGAGHIEDGFHIFTLPSSYYNNAAMSVIIIDPDSTKIIWLIGYRNDSTYGIYEYTY